MVESPLSGRRLTRKRLYSRRAEETRKYRSKLQAMQAHETHDRNLEGELARLEDEIAERREELVAVKSQVLRNDAAIERLLDMVCHGAK